MSVGGFKDPSSTGLDFALPIVLAFMLTIGMVWMFVKLLWRLGGGAIWLLSAGLVAYERRRLRREIVNSARRRSLR